MVTVDEVTPWEPAHEVYLHAAKVMDVKPEHVALVAAHDWDVHGAERAGLSTGWVGRKGKHFHRSMESPDLKGATLVEVAKGCWPCRRRRGNH